MSEDIVILKLITGEEIIGTRFNHDSVHTTNMRDVYLIKTEITDDLKVLVYMDPFMIYSDTKEFTFHTSNIILTVPANASSIEHYLKLKDSLSKNEPGDVQPFGHVSKLH
jgi:hypothetical protein